MVIKLLSECLMYMFKVGTCYFSIYSECKFSLTKSELLDCYYELLYFLIYWAFDYWWGNWKLKPYSYSTHPATPFLQKQKSLKWNTNSFTFLAFATQQIDTTFSLIMFDYFTSHACTLNHKQNCNTHRTELINYVLFMFHMALNTLKVRLKIK